MLQPLLRGGEEEWGNFENKEIYLRRALECWDLVLRKRFIEKPLIREMLHLVSAKTKLFLPLRKRVFVGVHGQEAGERHR